MLELQAELNAAREKLHYEATHDVLTGVFNRRAILDMLDAEFARANCGDVPMSIALCDIDFFKKINDSHGHQVGDAALKGFAKVVSAELRTDDVLGRYGGEEFLIIARGSGPQPNPAMFDRIRQKVETENIPADAPIRPFSVSMGVAHSNQADTVDALLALADTALYQAKREGRNRVCFA
jgi:diguanylate cyclase (GGDEF)-like protein